MSRVRSPDLMKSVRPTDVMAITSLPGRRRAAEGRGVATPRPPMEEGTMNRAPTSVRPAANGIQLGQHAVPTLPIDSALDVFPTANR